MLLHDFYSEPLGVAFSLYPASKRVISYRNNKSVARTSRNFFLSMPEILFAIQYQYIDANDYIAPYNIYAYFTDKELSVLNSVPLPNVYSSGQICLSPPGGRFSDVKTMAVRYVERFWETGFDSALWDGEYGAAINCYLDNNSTSFVDGYDIASFLTKWEIKTRGNPQWIPDKLIMKYECCELIPSLIHLPSLKLNNPKTGRAIDRNLFIDRIENV
jgi:hypothetical protein